MNQSTRAVVRWKHKDTGAEGHGQPISKAIAEAIVAGCNARIQDIHHWIEERPDWPDYIGQGFDFNKPAGGAEAPGEGGAGKSAA